MLTETEAKRLTTRIQLKLETIAEGVEKVIPLIEEARAGNAHEPLGYPSWTAYVADKFGGTFGRLERAERVPLVALLSGQGMSTRAIAEVTGASKSTVANDVAQVSKSGQVVAGEVVDTAGLDGKSYHRVATKEPRRPPLTTAYRNAVLDLDKAVRRLERLHSDDRFEGHRDSVNSYRAVMAEVHIVVDEMESDLGGFNRCHTCKKRRVPSRQDDFLCAHCRESSD